MRRNAILMTVSALAMLSAPAFADDVDFAGALTGVYSHIGSDLPDINSWGVNGAAKLGIVDSGFNVEIDLGHNHASVAGISSNQWNVGGALFYKAEEFRSGINLNYAEAKAAGIKGHVINYGAFGEYFASDMFTLGLKAGGFGGALGGFGVSAHGLYVGAGVTGYVMPNLGLSASLNFTNVNSLFQETDLGVQGEYLISEEIPVSGFAGYTYSDISNGGGNAHTVFVGLRLYTNTVGGTTLVERQRNGTVSSVVGFGPLGFNL